MPNDFLQAPTSDKELIQMALQGAKPPVEQMVAPEGPKNAQGDYLDALARYEQTFNEALRYLAQPPGQSNAPPGMAPPGVPTPQQFLRTQGVQAPLPQPPQVAASIAAAPPSLLQMQGGIVNMDTGHATPMPRPKPTDTVLSPAEEDAFQQWKAKYAPNDSGEDYDLRGAFKAGLMPGPNGHWPDTFKKPNHPTFSDESKYRDLAPGKAGHWQGETYVPPTKVQRAHAKLRDSEKKREKKFNPGKKVDPKDAPYKGGGDAEEARKTRLKSSIDSLFVP